MAIESTILLLQGETAYWFRIASKNVVDIFIQPTTNMRTSEDAFPAWLSASERSDGAVVELVLDTTLDEVDRVMIEASDSLWVNRYRLWITCRQLRLDYANAISYPIKAEKNTVTAGLMHFIIPDDWLDLLTRLQAAGIIFKNVSTATEILARWSRRFESPMFIVLQGAAFVRHLLVSSGKVIFLRSIRSAAEDATEHKVMCEARESLEHIKTHIPLSYDTLSVISFAGAKFESPGLASVKIQEHTAALCIAEDMTSAVQLIPEAASVLVSMQMEAKIPARLTQWSISGSRPKALQSEYYSVKTGSSKQSLLATFRKRISPEFKESSVSGSGVQCAMLLHPVYRSMQVFLPSVARLVHRRRIKWVARFTPVCLLASGIALLFAIHSRVLTTQFVKTQLVEQQALQSSLKQSRELASASHPMPAAASDSLLIAGYLPGAHNLQATQLLETIGTVITAVPGIVLDSMTWAKVQKDEDYDSLAYVLESVPARKLISANDNHRILHAELAGQVSAGSLQEKMHELDKFVQMLDRMPGALSVTVLQSPADLALSSNAGVRSVAHFSITFRIQVAG